MQIDSTHIIKITRQELTTIIKKEYNLSGTVEFALIDEPTTYHPWLKVPTDWQKTYCPMDLDYDTMIEVKYRNGDTLTRRCGSWYNCWVQKNYKHDIVEYRLIS